MAHTASLMYLDTHHSYVQSVYRDMLTCSLFPIQGEMNRNSNTQQAKFKPSTSKDEIQTNFIPIHKSVHRHKAHQSSTNRASI